MGILDKLFGRAVDPAAAASALESGRKKLWGHQIAEARSLLGQAARGYSCPAIPFAYLSLLERMAGNTTEAVKFALDGIKADERCHEANAALTIALITRGKLTDALESWILIKDKLVPHDGEGHHLSIVLFSLLIECILNMKEESDGLSFELASTPLVRGATRLLDGYPALAKDEFSNCARDSFAALAMGLFFYRAGDMSSARAALITALDTKREFWMSKFPGVAHSILVLLGEVRAGTGSS